MSRLTLVTDPSAAGDGAAVGALAAYLRACGDDVALGGTFDGDAVVVVSAGPPADGIEAALGSYADRGGVVLLAGPTVAARRAPALVVPAGGTPGPESGPHQMLANPH